MNRVQYSHGVAGALLSAVLLYLPLSAQAAKPAPAAPGYCSGGTATEGITTAGATLSTIVANDCYGVVAGNITSTGNGLPDGPAELNALTWGGGWTYFDGTDEASGAVFMGLKFTVTATAGTSGSWTLTGTDTNGGTALNFPTSLDFIVGLKAGDEYALWAFDDRVVDGSDTGTFTITFTNNGGNNPALSHLIVFGREAVFAPVPEASTYAMMLAGLGLVGFAVRRRAG